MLVKWLRRLKRLYALRKARIPEPRWKACVSGLPVLERLMAQELHRLRVLASQFQKEKAINGADGLEVTEEIRDRIAAQACLLILNLDLDYYDGWYEVIVYPDSFIVDHEETDEIGLVHRNRRTLGGESWSRGPVILSWADAVPNAHRQGANVILHEFAHKLDMLNGAANGMPPLHRGMDRQRWTRSFSQAYEQLVHQVEHHHTKIDPYAAESPAEFFAVVTEYFFEAPSVLQHVYPAIYEELKQFYRQDPVLRWQPSRAAGAAGSS